MPNFGNVSSYNFMVYGDYGDGAYLVLFNDPQFRLNYGIPADAPGFEDCNATVYADFYTDIATSYKPSVEYLLAQPELQVLLYNGQLDLICDGQGVQQMLFATNWTSLQQWKAQQKQVWYLGEQVVGNFKANDQLCYALVYNAGHLVPGDQPPAALNMLQRFLSWTW